MKRTTLLLTVLSLILTLVAWYMLLWMPRADALAETEAQVVDVQAQQATTQARITALQGVREEAPQLQAELAAAESLLPRDTALPSALRQLQAAADASNANLVSVAPSRPEAVEGASPGLFSIGLNSELRGTYFQVVDTLRRLEDPSISPRGLTWDAVSIVIDDEAGAPNLVVMLAGRMFAVLPATPAPGVEPTDPEAAETDATNDEAADGVDVEVDVDTEQETEQ
jgi:Tfp pilus assembly protein PilO